MSSKYSTEVLEKQPKQFLHATLCDLLTLLPYETAIRSLVCDNAVQVFFLPYLLF